MTRQRLLVPLIGAFLVAGGVFIALVLPMYTCMDPYEFEEFPGPGGGPTCSFTDTGYRPTSWLPTKITVAIAGVVAAIVVVLWARKQHLVAIGLLVAFAAVAAPWFIEDGWEETMRNGVRVCCGREIDRGPLRAGIVVFGVSVGTGLAIAGMARSRRHEPSPSALPGT